MRFMKPLFLLPVSFALIACEDLAVAGDPDAVAELRGNRSCVRAVNDHTGSQGAEPNTTVPVVEIRQFIVNAGDGTRWVCYTNEDNIAEALVQLPPEPTAS